MPEHDAAPKWMKKKLRTNEQSGMRTEVRAPVDDALRTEVHAPVGDVAPDEPRAVLTVIRGMPSRAHLLCQLGEVTNIVCYVRRADLFRKGMILEGARPRPDLGPRAWEYQGKLPRRQGQW